MKHLLKTGIATVGICGGSVALPASAGIVDDYCKAFPQNYKYCMERQEDDAVLALSSEARRDLFLDINARRKAGLESGRIKRTPVPVCAEVRDYGRLPKAPGVWAIKCDDAQMYGVQFDQDSVFSGMSCAFLATMLGSPCSGAVWMRENDGKPESAEPAESDTTGT
ncbi:hypothetical protein SAMN02745824_0411 [Parasphingorhabdus marina DSM 22363]|uniref:Uncharacterized protein n=1 Tax=Parasphingorhabdus marina DSM 22363 TaxID=1123272 RepID=A0A1N6CMU0_9SPHN|nr:hypothetical protein [Parasphingorhabdus marina]SIN59873.1 hypothetical protein SAMN02745824_0411 [Parasphingorhabdus marina DSM 22363]